MPKGENPNSKAALVQNARSREEAVIAARKGGKRSGEVRRSQTILTDAMKNLVDEKTAKELAQIIIKRAKAGNLKAFELVRDQIGEKPTEKVAVSTVNDEAVQKLQEAIAKRRSNAQTE